MTSTFFQRYDKARQSCALFHLEDWAIVRLTGKDTKDYLHRISTADVKGCAPGESRQTLFLNGDGRLVADCIMLCEDDELYYLVCPAACKENLLTQLDRFLFTEKVSFSDVSAEFYMALLAGPASPEVSTGMSQVCSEGGVPLLAYNVKLAPDVDRTLILIDLKQFPSVRSSVYEVIEKHGGIIADIDLFTTFRIEEGCPLFGKDTSEKTIPLEAKLKEAISFTKGCFPGQEIVARINNLGHPANILVGVSLPEVTESLEGRQLSADNKTIGRITSTCYSPALKSTMGLGFVKWNYREPGQVLSISGDEAFSATVIDLPVFGVQG